MKVALKPYPTRICLSQPHLSGKELLKVQQAFETNRLSTVGPNLDALEGRCHKEWGVNAVALASGTAAIHLGLKALGVGPGDQVVVSTLTSSASANPILYLGAQPVFIDSEKTSWNLDANLLDDFLKKRARFNKLPKAVVVVHALGQPANLKSILDLCRIYELPVLEDAAEAMGTLYDGRQVGTFADLGAFSFDANKIITASSGGLLVGHNHAYLDQVRHWSALAMDPDPGNNHWHTQLGYSYQFNNLLAGIALAQLDVLETRVAQRIHVFERYVQGFKNIPALSPMPAAPWGRHTRWLSCFEISPKTRHTSGSLSQKLLHYNIESRPVWKPLHTQPVFIAFENVGGAVAEHINRHAICLPSSSNLSPEQQDYVIECVKAELS